MSITLQSTVGGFDDDFMAALPQLEKTMVLLGLNPDDFIISKSAPQFPVPYMTPGMSGNPYDYTVFINSGSFTVTLGSDLLFLEYFYALCRKSA